MTARLLNRGVLGVTAGLTALVTSVALATPASAGMGWSTYIGSKVSTKCYTFLSCFEYVNYVTFTAKSRWSTGTAADIDLIQQRGRVWKDYYGTIKFDSTITNYNSADAYRKFTGGTSYAYSMTAQGNAAFQERGYVSWYPQTYKYVQTYLLAPGEESNPPAEESGASIEPAAG